MTENKFDKIKYNNEYIKNNYDSLRITTPKGTKNNLKKFCTEHGTTINGLINDYIKSLGLREE